MESEQEVLCLNIKVQILTVSASVSNIYCSQAQISYLLMKGTLSKNYHIYDLVPQNVILYQYI